MIDPKGKKKSSILWTPEAEEAFVKIREQVLVAHYYTLWMKIHQ